MFLALNLIVLAFGLFVVVLGAFVLRGRQWAWILSLVLLPMAMPASVGTAEGDQRGAATACS